MRAFPVLLLLFTTAAARATEGTVGSSPRRAAVATSLGLVVELRSDFGFERLTDVVYTTTDERNRLHLNDGLAVGIGWSFLPLVGGRLATRVTGGVKLDLVRASNGSAFFVAFPLDVMETAYIGPFRLGAGASVLLRPRLRATGFLEEAGFRFATAPGVVVDAEWIVARPSRTGIGVRGSCYRFSWNGVTRAAPAVGLVLRTDLPLR
jgi:hypothetical protein